MAWYNRYYNRYRRRWYKRRRARGPFRRTRRRYHRVRNFKRKLKRITVRQWQPSTIRKCHIKGLECVLLFNEARLSFNSIMYKDSIVPPGFPGGGGFSVMKFTLENLYDMHQHCTNWWTNSNDNLPLCRYLGCRLRCYRSELIDYILKIDTNLPAHSNKLTYPSAQPSMIMMSQNKHLIPSKRTDKRKRPYITIKIPPPGKLENKWYFQKEFRQLPLLVLHVSAASFSQYYINTQKENNNVTINSLNTTLITNRNFKEANWPYKKTGTNALYFYEYTEDLPHDNKFKLQHLVPLTQIKKYTQGSTYHEAKLTRYETNVTNYLNNIEKYTGNPFVKQHRETQGHIVYSNSGPQDFATKWKTNATETTTSDQVGLQFTVVQEPLIEQYRYNPFKDTGHKNNIYILKCDENTQNPDTAWTAPANPDIQLGGFPLWLNLWGFIDFQIRLGSYPNIMTNTMVVIQTDFLYPKPKHPIVLIDNDYLNNNSPYETGVNKLDADRWYPQIQYQTQEINKLVLTGPGTPKLYDKTSDQVVIEYDFFFKWGGEPAKMVNVSNPQTQIIYPMPSYECQTTSLQSPAQAIESTLYSFDQRYDSITKTALERIQKDWDFTNFLSSITETPSRIPEVQGTIPKTQTEETQEKTKEALLFQLLEHQQQQQQLRLGIIQLMKQLDT
nr:MAG: ORF1 [TTV-like mini virus]